MKIKQNIMLSMMAHISLIQTKNRHMARVWKLIKIYVVKMFYPGKAHNRDYTMGSLPVLCDQSEYFFPPGLT